MPTSDPSPMIPDGRASGATFTPLASALIERARSRASGSEGAAGPRLGRKADFASPPPIVDSHKTARAAVRRRYELQSVMQRIVPQHRVADCMRGMVGDLVEVRRHPASVGASYGQLATCGNAWVCPVCSAKVLMRRAEELAEGARRWQLAGGHLMMLTLTLQHERGTALRVYLEGLNTAYRALLSGKAWQQFKARYGLAGSVTRREITVGRNGWHPHLHGLLFFRREASQHEILAMQKYIQRRWVDVLHRYGFSAKEELGADLRPATGGADEYLSKLSSMWSAAKEISSADAKKALHGNKTIGKLLEEAEHGGTRAIYLIREYVEATPRKSVIRWSKGLRAAVFGSDAEKSDAELAAEAGDDAVLMLVLTRPQWHEVCRQQQRGQLLAAAVGGDVAGLALWCARRGLALAEWQIGYEHWHRKTRPGP